MGQFKPMVKMETTEPSVELKLAKGGAVKMKKGGSTTKAKKMAMGGGAMDMMSGTPALVGRPAVNAPVRSPMKPSMASRRKAMMAKKPMMPSAEAMPPMKKGGKAEGGESKAAHKAEMSAIKGVDKKLTKHSAMAASKGHKGLKTGGVANGQGGFKTGGVVLGNGGGYKDGGMPMKDGTTSGQGAITDRERKTAQDLSKGAYDKTGKYNRELEDAMNPLSMVKELAGKAKDFFMPKGSESVTKTKESVTVSPAGRKRGGMAC